MPTTPTLFVDGERHAGRPDAAVLERAREPGRVERAYTGPDGPIRRSRAPSRRTPSSIERLRTDATGEALRALYRPYGGELYGFALNALGERGAAEEIVQEVFPRAWRHAERYDPTRAGVRTWLYQIARHAIIDARRRAAVRPGCRCTSPADEPRRAARSSRRCSAGRSPRRSSGSAPSTAR